MVAVVVVLLVLVVLAVVALVLLAAVVQLLLGQQTKAAVEVEHEMRVEATSVLVL